MMSDFWWSFLTPIVRLLPSNVRFLGVILDPPPLKSDIVYERSLTISNWWDPKDCLWMELVSAAVVNPVVTFDKLSKTRIV